MTRRLLPHERQIRPRGEGTAMRPCQQCKRDFLVRLADVDAGNGRFCSVRCARASLAVDTESEFWGRVDKSGDCWLFTPAVASGSYGSIKVGNQKLTAHRYSWQLTNGPIPDGVWVLHRCDNPPCCNPAHLFLGDRSANMKDAAAKGRLDQQKNPLRRRAARATLTTEQVVDIKQRLSEGDRQADVARDFGLTRQAIYLIARGRNWKDVSA